MAASDAYKDLSPKMKRFAKANLWAFTGAIVASGFIRPWLGFWPTTILLVVVLLAVLVPLGVAARRERKELEAQRRHEN
jgi:Flp pilus assembly protein TadB